MRTISSPTRLFFSLALAISLGTASRAFAWCQMTAQNARGTSDCASQCNRDTLATRLAWRRQCSAISFSNWGASHDLASAEVRAIFQRAVNSWTTVTCTGQTTGLDVTLLGATQNNECVFASYFPDSPNVNSIIFVAQGWTSQRQHEMRAFALTLVFHDANTGEILDVDMEINDERPERYTVCADTGCEAGTIDLQNVVTHEMGHYFGLAHSEIREATMFCSAETTEVLKRDLDADDVTGLCTMYPSGSFTQSCNRTPIGGLGLSCRPRSCGCRVLGAKSQSSWPVAIFLSATMLALFQRRRRA